VDVSDGIDALSLSAPQSAAEEETVSKVAPEDVKKGGFAMIRGMPCKLTEVTHIAKATANGNKRLHLVGLHGACGCASIARAVRGDAVSR
jgi:hypothetical protein